MKVTEEAIEASFASLISKGSAKVLSIMNEDLRDALEAAVPHMIARTVSTREELDALEVTAVVRGKWLAEKWADPEGEMWHVAGKGMNWDTEQLIQRGGLPATVLLEPAP